MLGRIIGRKKQPKIPMPAPYSNDLRTKAISAVKRGEGKTDVIRMLNISRSCLRPVAQTRETRWRLSSHHELSAFSVDIKSLTGWGFGSLCNGMETRRKRNWQRYGETTWRAQNISDALRHIGVSRKKRLMGIKNQMTSSAKSSRNDWRQNLQLRLSMSMKQASIIALEYSYGYCKIGQRFHALISGKRTERVSWIAARKAWGRFLHPWRFQCRATETCLRCG